MALAATVHSLALSRLYPGYGAGSCLALLGIASDPAQHTKDPGDCPAHAAMEAEGERWGDRLPGDARDLWDWCLAQPQDELLALLAYLAALSVNAVQGKEDHPNGDRLRHSHALAEALGLDMAQWWTPSVDGFYGRLTKTALIHAVQEAGAASHAVISNMKKQEAARYVAGLLTDKGWFPLPLRPLESTVAAEDEA